MRKVLALMMAGFGITLMSTGSMAAGGDTELKHQSWHWDGIFGTYDREAMQRGFQVYQEVCQACHALEHIAFRHLGESGGPYYDEAYASANDNPVIKAIAKSYDVTDGPDDEGDMFKRPGVPADMVPWVFDNKKQAASTHGKAPPDLSLMISARSGGADYMYSLLTGYEEAPDGTTVEPGLYWNTAFEGNKISMAPPLIEGIVTYEGENVPEATISQMSKDVTEFLAWAADPKMEQRKRVGVATMLYLFIFAILLYLTYRHVWRNVEH